MTAWPMTYKLDGKYQFKTLTLIGEWTERDALSVIAHAFPGATEVAVCGRPMENVPTPRTGTPKNIFDATWAVAKGRGPMIVAGVR